MYVCMYVCVYIYIYIYIYVYTCPAPGVRPGSTLLKAKEPQREKPTGNS